MFTPGRRLPGRGKTWGGSEKGWRWRVTDEQFTAIQADEVGEDADRQDRTDHRAISPDDLPGVEPGGSRTSIAIDR